MTGFKITSSKGFHITLPNGWTVSVQFGPGSYCSHYNDDIFEWSKNKPAHWSSPDAEIAAWNGKGATQNEWYRFPDSEDTVKGYQSVKEVLEFIQMVSSFPADIKMVSYFPADGVK